jgi:c-di-GMP-binding flagellar brake protein YcgR
MEERRDSRTNLSMYLDILDQDNNQILGFLGDLSKDGMMFVSEQDFPIGQQRHLCIRVPKEIHPDKRCIEVQVEVRWKRTNSLYPSLQRIGCRFLEVDPDDRDILEKISKILHDGIAM